MNLRLGRRIVIGGELAEEETEESLLKDKLVMVLKPNECAIIYDRERGKLLVIRNENGKPKITLKKKIEEIY